MLATSVCQELCSAPLVKCLHWSKTQTNSFCTAFIENLLKTTERSLIEEYRSHNPPEGAHTIIQWQVSAMSKVHKHTTLGIVQKVHQHLKNIKYMDYSDTQTFS